MRTIILQIAAKLRIFRKDRDQVSKCALLKNEWKYECALIYCYTELLEIRTLWCQRTVQKQKIQSTEKFESIQITSSTVSDELPHFHPLRSLPPFCTTAIVIRLQKTLICWLWVTWVDVKISSRVCQFPVPPSSSPLGRFIFFLLLFSSWRENEVFSLMMLQQRNCILKVLLPHHSSTSPSSLSFSFSSATTSYFGVFRWLTAWWIWISRRRFSLIFLWNDLNNSDVKGSWKWKWYASRSRYNRPFYLFVRRPK